MKMLLSCGVILCALVGTAAASPLEKPSYPDTAASNLPKPERVKLFNGSPGLIQPMLIPQLTPSLAIKCKGEKQDGSVTLSFVVDSNGNPRNVFFEHALGKDADLLGLQILVNSRFHPATLNGSPVAVGQNVIMQVEVCVETTKDKSGAMHKIARLRSPLSEEFSDWHHPPAEANLAPIQMPHDAQADHEHPGADFTLPRFIVHNVLDARGLAGSFSFGVLIDEHGIRHVEKVLKSTNPVLLPIAIETLSDSRAIPALKDGMPVPVHEIEGLEFSSSPTN